MLSIQPIPIRIKNALRILFVYLSLVSACACDDQNDRGATQQLDASNGGEAGRDSGSTSGDEGGGDSSLAGVEEVGGAEGGAEGGVQEVAFCNEEIERLVSVENAVVSLEGEQGLIAQISWEIRPFKSLALDDFGAVTEMSDQPLEVGLQLKCTDELETPRDHLTRVAPPVVITTSVDLHDTRIGWRRPARLGWSFESRPSLSTIELWWWPITYAPSTSDEVWDRERGEPRRIFVREPLWDEERRILSVHIEEWGAYALFYRPPEQARPLTYRAIGGVSMGGGGASFIGSRHPERFDFIGALGGPSDWLYMMHYVTDRLLSGFCEGLDVGSLCLPTTRRYPLEPEASYSQFPYSDNGSIFDREQYIKIFQDVVFALGNPTVFNPQSPYLPPSVPASELLRSKRDRCALDCDGDDCGSVDEQIRLIGFYDSRFNPAGDRSVIPFCDGDVQDEPVGIWSEGEHSLPTEILLAVDLNENGRRDEGEPIITQLSEPFEDVGCDGKPNAREEGYHPLFNPDPAGDDFHWLTNPLGTEGDLLYQGAGGEVGLSDLALLDDSIRGRDLQDLSSLSSILTTVACPLASPGEPFRDDGLDGVPLTTPLSEGGFDWGEGNGVFDYNPNKLRYIMSTPALWVMRDLLSGEKGPRWWIDGGVRDVMNFAIAGMHLAGRLNAVSQSGVTAFDSFDRLFGTDLFIPTPSNLGMLDDLGQHIFFRYGDLDASAEEIAKGDGAHVGTEAQALSRMNGFLHWSIRGWKSQAETPRRSRTSNGRIESRAVISGSDQYTYQFEVVIPPGYDDPENADETYPVIYLLHGYGSYVRDFAQLGSLLGGFFRSGLWDPVILVFPDGHCSDLYLTACNDGVDNDGDGAIDLDDPACDNERGRTELEGIESPKRCEDGIDNDGDGAIDLDDPGCLTSDHDDEGECRTGTFYLPHAVNVDGTRVGRDYERAFLDMMDWVDSHYRAR